MPMPSKWVILFDGTGAANAEIATGNLNLASYDRIGVQVNAVGGVLPAGNAAKVEVVPNDLSLQLYAFFPSSAGKTVVNYSWGPGSSGFAGSRGVHAPRAKFTGLALGVGIQTRLIITARRQFGGPSTSLTDD